MTEKNERLDPQWRKNAEEDILCSVLMSDDFSCLEAQPLFGMGLCRYAALKDLQNQIGHCKKVSVARKKNNSFWRRLFGKQNEG